MQQLLEVAGIGLCTIVDEYLVDIEMYATRQEVVFQYGFTQEFISLFRAVAVESLNCCHLVSSLMHSLNDSRTERLGDIAYA